MHLSPRLLALAVFVTISCRLCGNLVISELMFNPPSGADADEWLEIHNTGGVPIDIGSARFSKGLTFTMPAGTTIPAGGHLVVAADVARFTANHPGFAGLVVGGWTGRLSNAGESVQLDSAVGTILCEVTYADEGDWARRARGPLSFSHRGWIWLNEADGDGRTLELRNPQLGAESGQNWGVSAVVGGTPGGANSIASNNVAPLITDVKHRPEIPRSTDPIVISCDLVDELPWATAVLHWRLDNGTWQQYPMGDTDGDGDVEATIWQQSNLAVIEFYIAATDGTNARTWPAPARTSNIGVVPETFAQVTNALVQVDNSFSPAINFTLPATQPIYRLVMTNAERTELLQIGTTPGQEDSEATMNGTFISHDGTGIKTVYNAGFRNRGQNSALGPPNNYHVDFRTDDRWNGRTAMLINCLFGYSQALGAALAQRAGLATQETAVVRVRVNGADLSEPGVPSSVIGRMYGRYVRVEGRGGEWAERHYPEDSEGNFYRLDDHDLGGTNPPGDLGSGEFRWEGLNLNAYSDTFIKETNKEANDYSDLISLCRIVSASPTNNTIGGDGSVQPAISNAAYPAQVAVVLDLDNFYRYIAADALIGNVEGGLTNGRVDDASLYRGLIDTRFRFIHHDLDTCFDIGDTLGAVTRNIFAYDGSNTPGTGVLGLTRLFNHPQLVPRYYAALLDATNTWFNNATVDPIIDHIMSGWVPLADAATQNRSINDIKAYIAARRANVLAAIQQNYSLNVTVNGANTPEGYRQTTTGVATFSGTFNVARTYSITVNGQLATTNYRTTTNPAVTAGTWSLSVGAGGGNVLAPGLNTVLVKFWDAPGGTGNVLQTFTANVVYTVTGQSVSGTLQPPGSLTLIAPDSYKPGVPMLVRIDQKDAAGALNRQAWNTTVSLTANNGVTISPSSVTLYNGMGSALVTVGGGAPTQTTLIARGGTAQAPNAAAPTWRFFDTGPAAATWNTDRAFDDSTWGSGLPEMGDGDGDERTVLANVTNPARNTWYFRHKFNVVDPTAFTGLTLRTLIDDGAVVYINGSEVQRVNFAPTDVITDTTTAANRVAPAENTFESFPILASSLVAGENLIAVEVHQSTSRVDLSFDLELLGNLSSTDPGNFTLTATTSSVTTNKAIASLASATSTNVSGTLSAGVTTWSGVVNVTSDVIVPAGATLAISAGTLVLMNGTPTAGDTSGADIIVNGGTLAVNGTLAQPVSITSSNPAARWGQIYLNGAQPTVANYLLMSRGGRAPGQGHTNRGPMWRLSSSSLTFNDSAMGDGPAKALFSSGTGDFVMQRSLMARMITGPETGNGLSILIEDSNIQEILPNYRDDYPSTPAINEATPDDEDCLYVHNGSNRPVNVRRTVFARCGDDVFDCLDGNITVEDTILREGWDKGMSLLNNNLNITRTLIVDCDKGIVPKASSAIVRSINVDRCTIVSENHNTTLAPWGYSIPPSSPDPDTPSTGLYTQNKAGQSDPSAILEIVATNSIVLGESPILVDAPYDPANTVADYSLTRDTDTPATPAWPGPGNTNADPLFVNQAADDYHLQAGSPAIDTGNPNHTDPDLSRADMGALPSGVTGGGTTGVLTWSPVTGPYRVTANTTVPVGLTLRILAGTSVYFSQGARLNVNGTLEVLGTPDRRVIFSHLPGTIAAGDCDPIKNGVQTGPPKWGGVRVLDSMTTENVVKYATFINAQGTDPATAENYGSLGFIRSWGFVEGVTFAGTHLRMLYGRNAKMTVIRCTFPDMFLFDTALGRIEEPNDFLASADNRMEPLKVEYPTTDPEVAGNPAYPNGLPAGGHWRVYYNDFNGNRGHQDVFDADSGRWNQPGQFVLDCRYNYFHGLSGDEHIDLGGDAYIASNIFERATKDPWTIDTGYSNAISSGDKGTGTTILVARNLFFDLDHAINCKVSTATIFEHNTVANFHADFLYIFYTPNQAVKCGPINFFIPENDPNPTYGDGVYMGFNIVSNVPQVFTGPDARKVDGVVVNDITTKIEFFHNLLDQIGDPNIGPNHPGEFFSGTYGPNPPGAAPDFVNAAAKDFSLKPGSLAKGRAPGGIDYGATVAEWAYIHGGPDDPTNAATASFKIGGPGIVAYKWRLNGGSWSAPVQIGDGGVMPRATPTVRQAALNLNNLAPGMQRLEVLGQDMAGNWQDADPARSVIGAAQAEATVRTWTVDPAAVLVRINEILADSATLADRIELHNAGAAPVNVGGWTLTDDPLAPGKYTIPGGTTIPAGGFVTLAGALALDRDGDLVQLRSGAWVVDSISFGNQLTDFTIGRIAVAGVNVPGYNGWTLCTPTFGAANVAARLGDPRVVRLNEWFASGDVLYGDDWIELVNPGPLPVDVAGLRLTDNRPPNSPEHSLPPLTFIPAGGFARFTADDEHLGFSLDAQQEEIALLDSTGALLDSVLFFPQRTDWSMGRNATGALTFYELPTRGLANETTSPAYLNALAILRGLRITEIMYNPLGGNDYEFVELRNVGGSAFNLAGTSFVNGITFTFGALTMNPGNTIVLVRNLTKFRARYGNGPVVAGTFGGSLDNSGEGLAIQLPPPYDASVLDFNFNDTWYTSTDGFGRSLITPNALLAAGLWGDRDTWLASANNGGEPAGFSIVPLGLYADWSATYSIPSPVSDGDRDGVAAVVEFGLGQDPTTGLGADGPAGLPFVTQSIDGKLELHLSLPESALATQGHGMSELTYTVLASDDLTAWSTIAMKTFTTPWSGTATVAVGVPSNGRVPVTIEDTTAFPPSRHVRLTVTWVP